MKTRSSDSLPECSLSSRRGAIIKRKRRSNSGKSDSGVSCSNSYKAEENSGNYDKENVGSLPFKKRKFRFNWESYEPNLKSDNKKLVVWLDNIFEDETLISKYDLWHKMNEYLQSVEDLPLVQMHRRKTPHENNKSQVLDIASACPTSSSVSCCTTVSDLNDTVNMNVEENKEDIVAENTITNPIFVENVERISASKFTDRNSVCDESDVDVEAITSSSDIEESPPVFHSNREVTFNKNNLLTVTRTVTISNGAEQEASEQRCPVSNHSQRSLQEEDQLDANLLYEEDSELYVCKKSWRTSKCNIPEETTRITSHDQILHGAYLTTVSQEDFSEESIEKFLGAFKYDSSRSYMSSCSTSSGSLSSATIRLQPVSTRSSNTRDSRNLTNIRVKVPTFKFKEPLPPAKRPPGRIKGSNLSATSSSVQILHSTSSDDREDSISLCASSLGNADDANETFSQNSQEDCAWPSTVQRWLNNTCSPGTNVNIEPEAAGSVRNTVPWLSASNGNSPESMEYEDTSQTEKVQRSPFTSVSETVKNNVAVPNIMESKNTESWPCVNPNSTAEFNEMWRSEGVEKSPFGTNCPPFRFDDDNSKFIPSNPNRTTGQRRPETFHHLLNQTPDILRRRLCLNYFRTKMCNYGKGCKFAHEISRTTKEIVMNCSPEELLRVYNFVLDKTVLFQQLFSAIIHGLVTYKKETEIAALVEYVIKLPILDRTPFIRTIIEALVSIGLKFKQAVKQLLLVQGCKELCSADILLNLIIERKNLVSDWSLIQKIIRFRTDSLDYGVISDIMTQCVNLDNLELYKRMDQDVLQKHTVDFMHIDRTVVENYLNRLAAHKLHKEYYLLRKNAHLFPEFTATPQMAVQQVHHFDFNADTDPSSIGSYEEMLDRDDSELSLDQICELSESLKKDAIEDFVKLLHRYKGTKKVDSFAVNTVALLNKPDANVAQLFWHMFKSLELAFPMYMQDEDMKAVIEQISFNVLDILTKKRDWFSASTIVLKFQNDFDGFLKTREFKKVQVTARSMATRFLYICKIFVRSDHISRALTIFLRPDLNLLRPIDQWKIDHNGDKDETYRNNIIKELLNKSLDISNLSAARTIIFYLVNENLHLNLDAWHYCNKILIKMIDEFDTFKDDLTNILKRFVLSSWYKHLSPAVLRGLCIKLVPFISEKEAMELYNKSCKRGVYNFYRGNETEVTVTTNMMHEEVYLALTVFFHKIAKIGYPVHDLNIRVACPQITYQEPKLLLNADVSFQEMKQRIGEVLMKAFNIALSSENCTSSATHIVLSGHTYSSLVSKYRTG